MSDSPASYQSLTAISYLAMLERLEVHEQIEMLAQILAGPLEEGVRPVLRREYLNFTEKART